MRRGEAATTRGYVHDERRFLLLTRVNNVVNKS